MKRRTVVSALGLLSFGASLNSLASRLPQHQDTWDLVVIGSGAAGLSAAVSAAQNGIKKILVLEKAPTLGGHTILSTGYLSAIHRGQMTQKDYEQQIEEMIHSMNEVGENLGDPALIRKLAQESGDAVDWLSDLGLVWSPTVYQTLAGISPRSYIPSLVRAGYDYIVTLNKAAVDLGVTVKLSTKATALLTDPAGRVTGVRVVHDSQTSEVHTQAVVLATGGFGGNVSMRKLYDPRLIETFTTTANPYNQNIDTAMGEGITMAQELGAQLVGMEHIQIIPFWGGRLTDYVGADIYLDRNGQRFVNEGASWKHIANAIWQLPGRTCWVVTDSQSSKGASRSVKLMKGIVRKADTIEAMAHGMGIDAQVLEKTLTRYNEFARNGLDADFGKRTFTQDISTPPYYYGREHLYVHYCCGGVKFDTQSRVIGKNDLPIPGLYAAGEVTGGLHGADRLGGCSITDCIVFGRNAGLYATRFLQNLV